MHYQTKGVGIVILKEEKEIWGIPTDELRKQGRKYRIYSGVVYILDIISMIVCGVYMYRNGAQFNTCVMVTIAITLLSVMLVNVVVNPEKWRAYLFYKKHKRQEVIKMKLYLKPENMSSILYCAGYKRKKEDGTMQEYQELMLSACCEDSVYAKRLGSFLHKFTTKVDDLEECKARFVVNGKKYYLIGFER